MSAHDLACHAGKCGDGCGGVWRGFDIPVPRFMRSYISSWSLNRVQELVAVSFTPPSFAHYLLQS